MSFLQRAIAPKFIRNCKGDMLSCCEAPKIFKLLAFFSSYKQLLNFIDFKAQFISREFFPSIHCKSHLGRILRLLLSYFLMFLFCYSNWLSEKKQLVVDRYSADSKPKQKQQPCEHRKDFLCILASIFN